MGDLSPGRFLAVLGHPGGWRGAHSLEDRSVFPGSYQGKDIQSRAGHFSTGKCHLIKPPSYRPDHSGPCFSRLSGLFFPCGRDDYRMDKGCFLPGTPMRASRRLSPCFRMKERSSVMTESLSDTGRKGLKFTAPGAMEISQRSHRLLLPSRPCYF